MEVHVKFYPKLLHNLHPCGVASHAQVAIVRTVAEVVPYKSTNQALQIGLQVGLHTCCVCPIMHVIEVLR